MAVAQSVQSEMGFWRYWRRVLGRACSDAGSFIGHSWQKRAVSIGGFFLATAGFLYVGGIQQAIGKIEWWALGLGGEFAIFLIALCIFLLRAPWLLERETVLQLENRVNDHQAQLEQHRNRIAELEAKDAARLKEADNSRQKALSHPRINKLKRELLALMEGAKASRPMSGPNFEFQNMLRAHAQKTKNALADWLRQAREEASKVSLDDYLATMDDLSALPPELERLTDFAQGQVEAIIAVVRKLE